MIDTGSTTVEGAVSRRLLNSGFRCVHCGLESTCHVSWNEINQCCYFSQKEGPRVASVNLTFIIEKSHRHKFNFFDFYAAVLFILNWALSSELWTLLRAQPSTAISPTINISCSARSVTSPYSPTYFSYLHTYRSFISPLSSPCTLFSPLIE